MNNNNKNIIKKEKLFYIQNESSIIDINIKNNNSMTQIKNKKENYFKKLNKIQNKKNKTCILNFNQFQNKITIFLDSKKKQFKLNFLDYIIPFCINKKRKKKINNLINYINIVKSNISIEKIFFFNYNYYPT